MPLEVTIKGLRELNDALAALPRNISKNVLRGSVRAGAAVVRDEAKRKAPVRTGVLRRALYVKQIREQSSAVRQTFYVGARRGKKYQKKGKGAGTGADAYYAPFVEYGHFARRGKGGRFAANKLGRKANRGQVNNQALAEAAQTGEVRWIPARPFLRPAWDARKHDALKALAEYLMRRIPTEAAKARR